ncbi:MAG: hypothetical protein EOQ90_34165 [Mesorhizobium sp.]|nr:MAG: hypothetical protein EOQ90_34165 [Mesorhizobium sp.]
MTAVCYYGIAEHAARFTNERVDMIDPARRVRNTRWRTVCGIGFERDNSLLVSRWPQKGNQLIERHW